MAVAAVAESPIYVACEAQWPGECHAWGSVYEQPHGCKLRPGHDGRHVCACGARHWTWRQT